MAQKPKRPDVRRRTSKNRVRGQSVTPSTQRRRSRAGAAASDGTQEAADFYATLLAKGAGTPFLLSQPKDVELGKVIKVIATDVLDYVRPRFEGDPIGELLRPERIVVTTVPQAPVQAVTVWMAPRHAIVVNLGLMLFMYRFARAASPHIIIRSETDPPAPPESEAISIIAALIDFMSSRVRAPLVRDWPAGPRETKTAENLTTAGERFVISHEIGHIIFRHLIADARHVDRATASLQDLDVRPLEQEIEADTGGALMAIESLPDPRPGAVGIVMFLHSLRLAESVGAIVPDGTHPTAVERMNTLWGVLPQRYGAQFATITSWANQLNELLSRLGDAALREREARRRKARQALDTIFREHPSQIVARNYAADRAMIADVQDLYFTVPGAVIDAVTGNLLDARQLQATSLSEDSFRRHRLALFIAHHLMPPAVRAALGISI